MPLTIEAIYENGVLKPVQPLPLREQERVEVTIVTKRNWVEETAGIIGFQGTAEEAEYFAMDPELSILEAYDHEELERCLEGLRQSRCQPPST